MATALEQSKRFADATAQHYDTALAGLLSLATESIGAISKSNRHPIPSRSTSAPSQIGFDVNTSRSLA